MYRINIEEISNSREYVYRHKVTGLYIDRYDDDRVYFFAWRFAGYEYYIFADERYSYGDDYKVRNSCDYERLDALVVDRRFKLRNLEVVSNQEVV